MFDNPSSPPAGPGKPTVPAGKEPEDIFADTDPNAGPAAGPKPPRPGTPTVPATPPATPKGAPKPAAEPPTTGPGLPPKPATPPGTPPPSAGKGSKSKMLMIVVAVVIAVVVVIVIVLALIVSRQAAPTGESVPTPSAEETTAFDEPAVPSDSDLPPSAEDLFPDAMTGEAMDDGTATSPTPPAVVEELEPEADLDSDRDGLTDAEEMTLGTDPLFPDSDNDGLFDREEVQVYNTDPLDPDSDGDGFFDGAEVKDGYNPNGPGKLLDLNSAIQELNNQ